jgi:hypothetical protein
MYIYDELIQIFKSALGRFVPVFVLPDALDRFPMKAPFRDHFLTFEKTFQSGLQNLV